jgi:hypothetical protein
MTQEVVVGDAGHFHAMTDFEDRERFQPFSHLPWSWPYHDL